MFIKNFMYRVRDDLDARTLLEFNFVLYITMLVVMLNTLWLTYNVGYSDGVNIASQQSISGGDWVQALNVRVGIALIVAIVGLWSRKSLGFIISMLALMYVVAEYAWWYVDSVRALEALDMKGWNEFQDPNFPYIGKLRGATWWDIVILGVTVTLFLWQTKRLIDFFKTSHAKYKSL